MDVSGTVDYEELEKWMSRRDEKAAAAFRANRGADCELAARPPWGSQASQSTGGGTERSPSGMRTTNSSRLPAVSSARDSQSPLDEQRHEYLRRDMRELIPMAQPTLHVEPRASQLEAAIMMHERGFQQRRLIYSKEKAAARAAADQQTRAQRRQLKEKNQQRLVESERQRKEEIAAKFGLKMTEIEPEEWAEVEAELEAQVERRERKKRRKQQMRNDPTGVKRKRERAKAKRTAAAIQIQTWIRGTYTRRVVVQQLRSEKTERERKEALRQQKRLEVCDAVVAKLITDLERLESMEQVELMNQLRALQNQKVQLEEQYHAALAPTETALAKAKAKRLADEGKFAQRWAKLQKKREAEQRAKERALACQNERAQTELPTIFGMKGDADASPPGPPTPAVEWAALGRGQQAAATRLGFCAQCWPELEENAIAAVPILNQDVPWDQWHAGTWRHINKNLLLGSVASVLGLTEWNWNKLRRCKAMPKRVYRIGTPPPVGVVETQDPRSESEAMRLHKLAVYFSATHEACRVADLAGQTPASLERFYDRLCTSLRPFIRVGMPESLARMLRDGLMQLGWAGGETSESSAGEYQQPGQDDAAVVTEDSTSEVLLIQLRAEETLKQLDAISGSDGSQVVPTQTFGLLAGFHIANFLNTCVQTVHSLRSDYHSVSSLGHASVAKEEDRHSVVSVVSSLLYAALSRMDAENAATESGVLRRVSHRLIDAFRFFDRDGDGKISPKELHLTLRSLTKGADKDIGADLSMKEIEQFMKEADADGDGVIDYRELVAHVQHHEVERARKAEDKQENERRKAQAAAQKEADTLAAAQQVRLDEIAKEARARIDAAEAEHVLKYEARRVLPVAFNRPFEKLGLAQEQAARRLGFTPEQWPRLSSASPAVVPWEKLDQASKRMAIVLGFDEEQDPATWVLIQVEGENGNGDIRSLGVVTGVRHAQEEFLQDEERKRRELEVIAFRKSVFKEAARVGGENLAASIEAQELQQQRVALEEVMQEEEAAVCIQQMWKGKQAKEEGSDDDVNDDEFVLSAEDQQHVDAIWAWSLAGDSSDNLSRQCLERYLMETVGRQLTNSLYESMCKQIGFDPSIGMTKSTFVMAFYGPYSEPGQSASSQIAVHYAKLDLAIASPFTDDRTLVTDAAEPAADNCFGISNEREAELRQVFACVDVNSDGKLSRAELILRLRKDADLAALLDLPVRVGEAERAAFEAVFQEMDENDDQEITANEFVRFFALRSRQSQGAAR